MKDKSFKTIKEQLNILAERGLIIDDEDKAAEFLMRNNYYRISGYSLTLRKNDKFYKTATFQNIMDIYNCDREMRHILLKYIEIIEITLKSFYAHKFTAKYGADGYLNASLFTDSVKYNDIIQKAEKQKEMRKQHEAYLKHFLYDLRQDIPLWAYMDLFTISDISFLYSISDTNLKSEIAAEFGLTMKRGGEILGKFMRSMTIIRNLCAHNSRLFNRLFEQKPSLNKEEKALLIKDKNGAVDNARLYGFILIMRRLLPKDEFAELKREIIALTQKYSFVNMGFYGFRDDWKDVL